MHIIQLDTANVKRLTAVSITPKDNSVIIGGDNAQGKSSVLDSIFMALGGKTAQGQNPVRNGEPKAVIKCDLGELVVTRTISPDGSSKVKVQNAEGAAFSSPQSILDALSSKLTFDPLAFANEKPGCQLETLKGLVGLDFTEIDQKRQEAYNNRTDINRDGKSLAAKLNTMSFYPEAPTETISVAELMGQLNEAEASNAEAERHNNEIDVRADEISRKIIEIEKAQQELDELQAIQANVTKIENIADTAAYRDKIAQADTLNAMVRANASYKETELQLEKLREESQRLSDVIKDADKSKADAMAAAKFPVKGLSFDATGILFNGVPFSSCSSAERLLVSLHMGIAMNPKLKVLLIRDGSLLDDKSLAMVVQAAKEADAQVWIERVSKGAECSVIIEDGAVLKQ
ncbi:AAA family ATPase [Desulfovibrio gilichinskyi]|uniref:AAA domain-containing protein n=1 Tax=Desulfovibrio gilichinskyi TaxID=1519643 RepID=A0A1X7C3K7_9BACT|nr:ATP-binding protein [Desulfovibrio gilichinskyi]SME89251.1 AAA domain-containing protein [Desulfovibrio gilichinskyi]